MHTISSLGTVYLSLLSSRYGTLTRSVTASVIAASGDVACQAANGTSETGSSNGGSKKWLDLSRTMRMSLWPLLTTPLVARWYTLLGSQWPRSPLKRMIADQLIWAPPATMAMLMFFGGLEHRNGAPVFDAAQERVKASYIPTLTANWAVWPAVQLVNFAMVPPSLQILFSNLVGLGWGFYLSKVANPTKEAA